MFWKKKEIITNEPLPSQIDARLNQAILDYNQAFAHNHLILAKMGAALERLEATKKDEAVQLRQFCVQTAAMACQRHEAADVIQVANRIYDYILQNPNQVMPDNLIAINRSKSNG